MYTQSLSLSALPSLLFRILKISKIHTAKIANQTICTIRESFRLKFDFIGSKVGQENEIVFGKKRELVDKKNALKCDSSQKPPIFHLSSGA